MLISRNPRYHFQLLSSLGHNTVEGVRWLAGYRSGHASFASTYSVEAERYGFRSHTMPEDIIHTNQMHCQQRQCNLALIAATRVPPNGQHHGQPPSGLRPLDKRAAAMILYKAWPKLDILMPDACSITSSQSIPFANARFHFDPPPRLLDQKLHHPLLPCISTLATIVIASTYSESTNLCTNESLAIMNLAFRNIKQYLRAIEITTVVSIDD